MISWMKEIDRILRGEATRLSNLRLGRIEYGLPQVTLGTILLAMVSGLCMACFALFKRGGPNVMQSVATVVKVPLLFFLTLLVTFPSLYVFNALIGSRLTAASVLRLLIAAFAVMMPVLAALGAIVAFFSVSTTSYPFMLLLNVVVFSIAGVLGLNFLMGTLHRLTIAQTEPLDTFILDEGPEPAPGETTEIPPVLQSAGPLDRVPGYLPTQNVKIVFRIWVVVFGLVGAQMAWVLRPFLGNPNLPFHWFRLRESNFFEAVTVAARHLFGG